MFDFPNSPTLGQAANGYQWDGEKWTGGAGPATPVTEQFFTLDGLASLDVQVPTWAKGVDIIGVGFMGATTNFVQMQVSFDGTTFVTGSNYLIYGPQGNTGSSLFQPWGSAVGESGYRFSVSGDQGIPQHFEAQLNLTRATTANHFAYKSYSRSLDGAAANLGRVWFGGGHIAAATTAALAIKALRLWSSVGTFGAGSWVRFRWLGDFAQVPTGNAIPEAPMDGQGYVRENGVWVPSGIRKLGSGVTVAAATLDIAFPAGYSAVELLLMNLTGTVDSSVIMRFSTDGTTFYAGAADYAYSLMAVTAITPAVSAAGSTGSNAPYIVIAPSQLAAANRANFRLLFPTPNAGSPNNCIWDGNYSPSGNYCRVSGHGFLGATAVPLKAVRFAMGTGNLAAGLTWQLNGLK